VRVDTDRLDQLMDLAGQLVINRAQLTQISERFKAAVDDHGTVHAIDKLSAELFEAIHQLDRVSKGIQKGVMDIRMVPVGPLFARFHRVVRDISRANGKQIRLEIAGEKTELDKRMIDELGDPLVHLVRNAADHGIELPEQREAAGKPRQGTVTLNALHRGNSIVIEVRDDGKGLDADRILRKALDKGLVAEADAHRLTASQIYQLIWRPGLSTAEKVTDVSGRGMGMDIVKTKIEELSGTVDISSEQGKGTTITIKLPLTLAILPSLMVDIAGDIFAMPMEAVTEIVSVGENQVRTVRGRPMATVRGRVVSLVRLGDLLSFHRADVAAETCQTPGTTLVVVSDAGREIGLAVDRVIGEEDVVIKSIAENYENIRGIAGASILGDGRVALILDIPALIAALSKSAALVTC
jgi:two-component system chemotaxis sensor kinase CheA